MRIWLGAPVAAAAVISLIFTGFNFVRDIRDRKIAARPYLTKSPRLPTPRGGPLEVSVLRNAGQGPALNARWCRASEGAVCASMRFDLAPGQEVGLLLESLRGPGRDETLKKAFDALRGLPLIEWELEHAEATGRAALAPSGNSGREEPREAIVCEDYLGACYRFWIDPPRGGPETWKSRARPRHPEGWTKWRNTGVD